MPGPASGSPIHPAETVLRTTSWDEACAAASAAYFPHRLSGLPGARSLDMDIRTVTMGPLTIVRLRYGADVRLECGELGIGYEVNIPTSGQVESVCGREEVASGPGRATVYLPVGRTSITRWSADCAQFGIKFERTYLETELERLLQHPARLPLRLAPSLDVSRGTGLSWLRLVRALVAQLGDTDALLRHRLVAGQLCSALTAGFLLATSHDYHAELAAAPPPARPKAVRRAIDVLESRPDEPWSVIDLAATVGSSVRRLQEGFRQYVGMSPMTYLREVRLRRAHEDLGRAAEEGRTVADVAHRWGFTHLGRFAAAYRKKYGVAPSHTLSLDG